MPAAGRKPNVGQPVRHRVRPVHDWIEVERVVFAGGPKLPVHQPNGKLWPKSTRRWWQVVSAMPHCVLWDDGDWQFALDTAVIAAAFHDGDMRVTTELRQREKILGTTLDARRDLRIRYVDPPAEEERQGVTAIEAYKARLTQ